MVELIRVNSSCYKNRPSSLGGDSWSIGRQVLLSFFGFGIYWGRTSDLLTVTQLYPGPACEPQQKGPLYRSIGPGQVCKQGKFASKRNREFGALDKLSNE